MILAAIVLVWIVLGVLMYRAVKLSSADEFDERLRRQARVVLGYAEHEYAETGGVIPEAEADTQAAIMQEAVYQIWTRKQALLYRSPHSPATALAPIDRPGFSDLRSAGQDWRVFAQDSRAKPLVVIIAEPAAQRQAIAARAMRSLILPLVAGLGLLAGLVWLVGERAFKPLQKFAAELTGRAPDDLSPVSLAEMPVETASLGESLNGLLQRQSLLLERERRFTADAAHELRTPLAALRAQAQVATRASSWAEAKAAQQKLLAGVDRAARLVNQLLTLARLEPGAQLGTTKTVRIDDVLAEVISDLQPLVNSAEVNLQVECTPVRAIGDEDAVYLMLRNLVENAIQHSPPRGRVNIQCHMDGGSAHLQISDQGPGIAPAERQSVFDRFYRAANAGAGKPGSGLGLSIVRRVAELHRASVELQDGPGGHGLTVTVRFAPHAVA
jgi:signal transduction histidine kinase